MTSDWGIEEASRADASGSPIMNDQWLNRDEVCLARVTQRKSDPAYGPVIARGEGCRVWDIEGRSYFDLICGYSAANFGHSFPPFVEAARRQLDSLTHVTGLPHVGRTRLAESLLRVCGREVGDKVVFNTCGSRAIETAIKACWKFRPGRIVTLGPHTTVARG